MFSTYDIQKLSDIGMSHVAIIKAAICIISQNPNLFKSQKCGIINEKLRP